jgi:hypothetical protein
VCNGSIDHGSASSLSARWRANTFLICLRDMFEKRYREMVSFQRLLDVEVGVRVFGTLDLKPGICICALLHGFGDRIPIQATLYLFMGLYIYYTISV